MAASDTISSKEILERTGISRSTLNNYISLGILPKPVVRPADEKDGRAPRVGYFPRAALKTLKQVDKFKRQGHSMSEIVDRLLSPAESSSKPQGKTAAAAATETRAKQNQQAASKNEALPSMSEVGLSTGPGNFMLTMGDFHHPAYLVNSKFEVEWANTAAEREIFGLRGSLPVDSTDRNLFSFFAAAAARPSPGWDGILQFHIGIAKKRLSKSALFSINVEGDADVVTKLGQYYDDVPPTDPQPLLQTAVMLEFEDGAPRSYNLYASFFREGIFFAYVPAAEESDGLLNFLSRRDLVIRDLLQNRRPYLTPLAVLVADVQDSVKICAELPPEEYFELITMSGDRWRRC